MSNVLIRSTITIALKAWAATKGIPICEEGHDFEKPADNGTYIELKIMPADTITSTLDGSGRRYFGDVMMNIWVKDGNGTGEAEALADEIAALFPVFPKTYLPISVEQTPSLSRSLITEDGYRVSPLSFPYRGEF